MASTQKIRVAVLYGGRSGEHQISLRSAASVIRHLDREMFDVIPISIDEQGRWRLNDLSLIEYSTHSLPVFQDAPQVLLPPNPSTNHQGSTLIHYEQNGTLADKSLLPTVDVVFPVMHGPLCEDGTIQGLLELADLPYVGCGVLASAVAMDKEIAKRLFKQAGIPVVPYLSVKKSTWKPLLPILKEQVARELGLPCFVKPANLGSSVGVRKVKQLEELESALKEAFCYDQKILIEKAIPAREIEIAMLEDIAPGMPALTSIVGEIVPHHEFYSYEAKYIDPKGASLLIPAPLADDQSMVVKKLAQTAFAALECEGMARIDFFLDRQTGQFYLNEINTIPGFTSISMYPKLWEASGISYPELLSRLIQLALLRHRRKQELVREFHR